MACFWFPSKSFAQVTFLDSALVTNEAFSFWKADNDKPYHYGADINPHGNCIKVYKGYVFYTWYRGGWSDRTLMISRLKVGENEWKHVALPGQLSLVAGLGDTHLTTNVGICPIDSSIHIMYDHHNEDLNYIRSKSGVAFGPDFTLDGFLPQQDYLIAGKKITSVTYPNLFNNDNGDMFFERRLGSAVGGDIIMTYYNGKEWSEETTIINGRSAVTQGERNFCYGSPAPINGDIYYTYSVRWAESPTTLDEGVYLMNVGERMDQKATNVDGKSYDLPVTDQAPFLIADPRSVPTTAGWAGGPSVAISPKGDIYLNISPKNTDQYNYLRKAGETEFTEYRNKGALGKFYGNKMYKFVESGGYLYVKSCLAGTYTWGNEYSLYIGKHNFSKSKIIMQDGYIAAVYKENISSDKVPIYSYVFKIEKSEYTPQSITFNSIDNKTEGDTDFMLNATASSKLPVSYRSSNTSIARIIEGNKVKIMGVGTCDIIASQAGDGEYDTATEVTNSFTVSPNTNKADQTISFTLANTNYNWESGDISLSANASSGLTVLFESSDTAVATIVNNAIKVKRTGQTIISAIQSGNETYNAAPIIEYELTVPKREQIITVEALPTFESGDADYTLNVSSNNPNAKLRYVCANNQVAIVWDKYIREFLSKGTATLEITDEGDEYFTSATMQQTITVNSKTHVLPCKIEAEYCKAKSGVSVTRWSNSVFYLNSWDTNDYSEYDIEVPEDGVYQIETSAATGNVANRKLKFVIGSTTLATATLTTSSSLTNFKTTKVNVQLTKGTHTLKIVGVVGNFNLNWINISSNNGGEVDPGSGEDQVPDYVQPQYYTIVSSDGAQDPNVETNLFDGNVTDDYRWSANGYPKSVVIDLGMDKEIIGTRVWTFQARAYQYTIELSKQADQGYETIVDRSGNTSTSMPITNDFTTKEGRYVKITVTGCEGYASTWISINELALIFQEEQSNLNNEECGLVTIVPNPSDGTFKINLNKIANAQVKIYNMNGAVVYDQPYAESNITLSSGLYIIKIRDNDSNTYHKRLVIN